MAQIQNAIDGDVCVHSSNAHLNRDDSLGQAQNGHARGRQCLKQNTTLHKSPTHESATKRTGHLSLLLVQMTSRSCHKRININASASTMAKSCQKLKVDSWSINIKEQ